MTQAAVKRRNTHQDAVALVEEMAVCLGLQPDYVRELTEQVTGQPWDDLDTEGAEALTGLLADALHLTLASSRTAATHGDQTPKEGASEDFPR